MQKQPGHALSTGQIHASLAPFGVKLSEEQIEWFRKYLDLLIYWNRTVNLTATDDPEEIVGRHFGESIFALSIIAMPHGRLADVGSGAGFPGLPLKIASVGLDVLLMEPNLKKCAFLAELVAQTGLSGISVARMRYEEYSSAGKKFDFIVSRALGNYKALLRWARNVLEEKGKVILWLGAEDSVSVSKSREWEWEAPFLIPGSRRRVVLVGRPKT